MKTLMENVMNQIKDLNAEGDLIFSDSKVLKMSAQGGAISEYKVSSAQILGVRVVKNDSVGISFTEALDRDSVRIAVKQALQNAEANAPNVHEKIIKSGGELLDQGLYPEEETDIKVKTEKALWLESAVKALDSRVTVVPHNSYSENIYQSLYLNSSGRKTEFSTKTYSIVSSALLEDRGRKANYHDYHLAHRFQDLNWKKVVETSLYHAKNILSSKTLPTGKYQVIFSQDCLQELMDCFSDFFSAKAVLDKVNPWENKLHEQVISADLSIEDHPLYVEAFRTKMFDSEGVASKALSIVLDGKLNSFIHNSLTASQLNTVTTGHASRGPASSLDVATSTILIKGKNQKPLPPKYLEVIQMDGLYSGANSITGAFSVGIKGYLWEHGEKIATVGGVTLSGNLLKMLNDVEVVGEILEPSNDLTFFSVPLVFHDISIAGE